MLMLIMITGTHARNKNVFLFHVCVCVCFGCCLSHKQFDLLTGLSNIAETLVPSNRLHLVNMSV